MSSAPQQLTLDDEDIARRLRLVRFGPDDAARLAEVRPAIVDGADALAEAFFSHLRTIPEARGLFDSQALLEEARRLKRAHIAALALGTYGRAYVDERLRLGRIYGAARVPVSAFLAAFQALLAAAGERIRAQSGAAGFAGYTSISKIAFFDIGIIVDVLIDERERVIGSQRQAIMELSTPVLQVRDGLVVLPIIGAVDSERAAQLTESLLRTLKARRARVVILDVTGVPTMDTRVANHLLRTVDAARMMGATAIITGISVDVARSLVTLGIDLGTVRALGDLQEGIEVAERILA